MRHLSDEVYLFGFPPSGLFFLQVVMYRFCHFRACDPIFDEFPLPLSGAHGGKW
jgi:hypothetical protein